MRRPVMPRSGPLPRREATCHSFPALEVSARAKIISRARSDLNPSGKLALDWPTEGIVCRAPLTT